MSSSRTAPRRAPRVPSPVLLWRRRGSTMDAARLLALLLALLVAAPAAPVPSPAACAFRLGFAALHDLVPQVVGDCVTDEHHNPLNGDGLQETTRGLLVWRKADNWTAFTDGSTTWVNGPCGLQIRPNER